MFSGIGQLKALATAVQQLYGTSVLHLETVWLAAERMPGGVGNVEVFAVIGAAESRRCFVWPTNSGEAVVMLASPSINTAEDAVRAFYSTQVAEGPQVELAV